MIWSTSYDKLDIGFFTQMVREVFARTPNDPAVMNAAGQALANPAVAEMRYD